MFSRVSCGLLPTGKPTAAPRRWRSRTSRREASWEKNCLSHSVFRLSGTATEFTELLCISRGRLKALLEEHPAIGVKLLQCFLASLSEKIMRSNELRREAAAYDHNAVNGGLRRNENRRLRPR